MNISKLLLSTSLLIMSCSNINATETYEELGINDFTYDYLSSTKNYSVDTNGALYRTEGSKTIYPTFEKQKLYDLQTRVSKITSDGEKLTNPEGGGVLNLVVFSFNHDDKNNYNYDGNTTYIVTAPTGISFRKYLIININISTNLIIPQGTTLDCNNVQLMFSASSTNNNMLLILGNITNKNITYTNFFLNPILCGNSLITILGPQAVYDYNKIDRSSLISYQNAEILRYNNNNVNYILYPGCEIKTNDNNDKYKNVSDNLNSDNKFTIHSIWSNLCLNRYVEEKDETNRNKLIGSIPEFSNIIYPTTMCDDNENSEIKAEYTLIQSGKKSPYNLFSTTSYFPSLYWKNTNHVYDAFKKDSVYRFEKPDDPIIFDSETKVLRIKNEIENPLAKYDVAFWGQCKVESGMYSFNEFCNVQGKYIDLKTIENLFMNGKTYKNTGLLQNMPSEIFVGLIGEKDIKISKNNSKNILLLGDNKQYKGTITIPNNTTDIYLKTISKISKIKYKDKTYYKDNIPNITFHYIDKATLPITPSTSTNTNNNKQSQQNNNVNNNINNNINNNNLTQNKNEFKYIFDLKYNNEIKLDLKDNMSTSHDIVLEDNGLIQNTILWLKGDNRDFKGMLITPKNIETVIFYPNSFCKVINPSGKKLKYKFVDEHGNTDDE